MPDQLDLFALMRNPPVRCPVDPDGPVIQGEPDETLRFRHPRLAWDIARIELHLHSDGLWMWATSGGGGSYKVGPKWGRFARTRDDALYYATQELLTGLRRKLDQPEGYALTAAQIRAAIAWAEALT